MVRDGRVRVLDASVARKIAAGEVIDRPAAVVRELIDNALDSGALCIDVTTTDGGLSLIEVADDGCGMTREDLELCSLPHATSKIVHEEDLLALETLGFRGEALGSIAAVAGLEILSSTDGNGAARLAVGPAGTSGALTPRVESAHRARGTTVRVRNLFANIPARRKFMKRDASETSLILKTLVEKALPFPQVSFRLVQDGRLRLLLPKASSLAERFSAAVLEEGAATKALAHFVRQVSGSGPGFKLELLVGGPELSRTDRRLQFIYANARRIQEYSFQQAIEYGSQGWFPNNRHPVAALFLTVDGPLIDFNIHPAKREARFRDAMSIHRSVSAVTRAHFEALGRRENAFDRSAGRGDQGTELFDRPGDLYPGLPYSFPRTEHSIARPVEALSHEKLARQALAALVESPPDLRPLPEAALRPHATDAANRIERTEAQAAEQEDFRYMGQAFGLFLVVEQAGELLFIDQHAAHERILFDRLMDNPPASQELLVPVPFQSPDRETSRFLASRRAELAQMGIGIEEEGSDCWLLTALPGAWTHADGETIEAILSLSGSGEALARSWYALLACKKAVKDGQVIDETSGYELAREALALKEKRCPHGRPILTRLSRAELAAAVERT